MTLLALLACSEGLECPPNAVEKDGECVPVPAGDSGTDPEDTGTDTDPTDTDPTTGCAVTSFTSSPLGEPVNNRHLTVTLDTAAGVDLVCTLAAGPPAPIELLPTTSTWSWWDDAAVDPGWADPGFDDSAWSTGPAPLGYGESVTTEIGYGGNADQKHITAWFRTRFEVTDPTALADPRLTIRYDDAAVVWLNGVELDRWNLPEGALTADTLSETSIEATTSTLDLDPGVFVAGTNVLAVELHQSSATTSDAWFELGLTSDGPAAADEEERFVATGGPASTVGFDLRGLLADSRYTCVATPDCGPAATLEVETEPLPAAIPGLSATGTMPTPGYVLFNTQQPCLDLWPMYLVIVDPAGRVRWYDHAEAIDAGFSTDVESIFLDDGTILWAGGDDPEAVPQRVDLDGATVWTSSYPGVSSDQYHHDVVWTADGTVAGIVHEDLVTRGGSTVAGWTIVEQDPATDTELWRWNAQSAYDAGTLRGGGGSSDPWHANALASVVDADGPAFYVNLFYAGDVVRIDRTTGELTWTFGEGEDFELLDASGNPDDGSGWPQGSHALHVIDATHISVYDNGSSTTGSRYIAYELDTATMTARVTEEWSEGWYNATWGDADRLADGLVLVDEVSSWCTGGTYAAGSLLLADPATGDVPWRARFDDVNDSSYRAQWIDGCAVFGNEKYCPGG